MAFLDNLKTIVDNIRWPKEAVFLKEDSDLVVKRDELEKSLLKIDNPKDKETIEQQIRLFDYGIAGENAITFELKNGFYPMIVLHDLKLQYKELSAQIDYMIFTPKRVYIVECKNLYGDIEINANGDFIRTIHYGKIVKKEGIYSPITQNKRHMDILKNICIDYKSNIVMKALFDKFFDSMYKSVIVLSNPKAIVNMKYAKKEVKEQVVRCDHLIEYIKNADEKCKEEKCTFYERMNLAKFFLGLSMNKNDLEAEVIGENNCSNNEGKTEEIKVEVKPLELEESGIYQALKEYRLKKCREEKIKAYYIYNNEQLEEIINKNPKTLEELKMISGFGEVKCQKYGEDILNILHDKK